MFKSADPTVAEEYVVRIETSPGGNEEDILVCDRTTLIQVTSRATKKLAPNAVSALISDLREYALYKPLTEDVVIRRCERQNVAMSAAIKKFGSENAAETWLLTPNAAFGFQCGLGLAASTDQGLSFVLSVLSQDTVPHGELPTDRSEQALLTEVLESRLDARPDEVDVLKTLALINPILPGGRAWLIGHHATRSAKHGVEVVVPGTTTPQQAEAALLAKREEYENCVARLDEFITLARQSGALTESLAVPN